MKMYNKIISKCKEQRGVTAVVVAIALVMLISFVALGVDIGYVAATKNELQNVTDASALAATGFLGQIYSGMTYEEQQNYNCSTTADSSINCDAIRARAYAVVGAGKNKAGGENISIDPGDVFINKWTGSPPFGTNDYSSPDAVRIIARRDGSVNGPITTFFAKIFGIDTVDVKADATAALTGPAIVGPGKMRLPVGLSENQFYDDLGNKESGVCSRLIEFSPTKGSCAGWHNFFSSHSASALKKNIFTFIDEHPYDVDPPDGVPDEPCGLTPCGTTSPPDWFDKYFPQFTMPSPAGDLTDITRTADSYDFIGGDVSSLFNGAWIDWPDRADQSSWDGAGGGGWMDKNGIPIDETMTNNPAPFPALFDYFRFRDNESIPAGGYLLDPDGIASNGDEITDPDLVWTTTAPIFKDPSGQWDTCSNPSNMVEMVGFTTVHVLMPNGPPDTTVKVVVDCDMTVIDARGGGGTIGNLKGSIPNLVE
jgi:hypothetical protein